ncbi:MAG: outer membrane lipoprotein chaperone LolA [Gammaproteobacteria bacterium]|jgi:outer membrane lipoprotein carrier protein|nr:outer membrane lipoprotein chaperone LolA [Gammaproteobacteria bacterium]
MKPEFRQTPRALSGLGMLVLLWLCSSAVLAQEQPIESGRERLRGFLSEVHSLRANFVQTLYSAEGDSQPASSGRLLLERPGRFRWDYETPYQQLVLSDGENLWSVDPELEQAVVRKLNESMAASPAMLLSGSRDLEEVFSIELVKRDQGLLKVYLAPLEQGSDFQALMLGFDDRGLARLELVDNLDQVTRIDFSEIELNPDLDEASFQYVPPQGMDVINQG